MTPATLREVTGLYARFRQGKALDRPSQSKRAEIWWLRTQLEDLGLTDFDTPPPDPRHRED